MGVITEARSRSIRESYMVHTEQCVWKGLAIERRYLTLEEAELSARQYVKIHGNPVSIRRLTFGSCTGWPIATVRKDINEKVWTDLTMETAALL